MSTSTAGTEPPHAGAVSAAPGASLGPLSRPGLRALGAFALGCAGIGLIAGVCWRALVELPAYRLDDASHALIAERGLASMFATDAWFACLGVLLGAATGVGAWVFFRRWQWRAVLVGALGSLLAALVCWGTGVLLGPGPLERRLARAEVGDVVPIDFQLHAHTAIALWPAAAMIPLLLAAAMAGDPAQPRRPRVPGARHALPGESAPDRGHRSAE